MSSDSEPRRGRCGGGRASSTRSPAASAASARGIAPRTSARSSPTRSRRPTSSPTPPPPGDDAKLLDELGDVLFQVHFLSLLLEERGEGDLAAVAENTTAKLIRRHPHVFGEVEVAGTDDVRSNWDRIKREQEGRGAEGPFADVPENLPGLLYARKLQRRAASAGLPGPAADAGEAAARLEAGGRDTPRAPMAADPEDRTDEERDRIEDGDRPPAPRRDRSRAGDAGSTPS